jgi:choline dehydrogenase
MSGVPRNVDTLILGGGTSGLVIAGRIAERSSETILVAEAGPDYGALDGGRWPSDLLDARVMAFSHDWGYSSGSSYVDRVVPFDRARVIGGCSSHNGCAAIWGYRSDYDAWAEAGNPGWSTNELLPFFAMANERMRVRYPTMDEATPFQRASLRAAEAAGIPLVTDLNDLDEPIGMGLSPVNIADGVRWNSSLAYLESLRNNSTLTIAGNHLADRLVIEGGRVTGAWLIGPEGPVEVRADRTIISAGVYGSPAILLRSGVGNPDELRAIGIPPVHELPGVGRNLHDHPMTHVRFPGTPELIAEMHSYAQHHWAPDEQTIAKLRSSRCADAGFDLHMLPFSGLGGDEESEWSFVFPVACMTPKARGVLRLSTRDPETMPLIDHNYLGDPEGHDLAVLVEGVQLTRQITTQEPLRSLLGEEITPGSQSLDEFISNNVGNYYHPVGTCKMGPDSDADAVVDHTGAIHGLEGGYVADCSIMPVVPRANTNIPAIVVGERIAAYLT